MKLVLAKYAASQSQDQRDWLAEVIAQRTRGTFRTGPNVDDVVLPVGPGVLDPTPEFWINLARWVQQTGDGDDILGK